MITPLSIQGGMHSITPHLVCAGAAKAVEFYKSAFDAEEISLFKGPDGSVMNAQLRLNGSSVMLVDENVAFGILGPLTLGGSSVTIHLFVTDVDAAMAQAEKAGAIVTMPAEDQFWGDRYGAIQDPFGHKWSIATPLQLLNTRAAGGE